MESDQVAVAAANQAARDDARRPGYVPKMGRSLDRAPDRHDALEEAYDQDQFHERALGVVDLRPFRKVEAASVAEFDRDQLRTSAPDEVILSQAFQERELRGALLLSLNSTS
jgi:hypothetical protein